MIAEIVLGLNFGDEGKGTLVNYLCSGHNKPTVVRFSGGHHVGHTVTLKDGRKHIFHSFGSGVFVGAPTFWSKYCTVYPITFMKEYTNIQKSFNIFPISYFDPDVSITTYYDVLYNQALEKSREIKHGTIGLGFGATIERQLTPYTLYFRDLYYPSVMNYKLNKIKEYYMNKLISKIANLYSDNFDENEEELFRQSIKDMLLTDTYIKLEKEVFLKDKEFVFEGSQGILLDQNFGFFPNVTRSNTTSKNAIEIIERNYDKCETNITVNYVSRIYMTRHGNGLFPTENKISHLIKLEDDETNFNNIWQGQFRKGCLDLELIQYAIKSNEKVSNIKVNKSLVFTCMDHLKDANSILIKDLDMKYKNITYMQLCKKIFNIIGYKNIKIMNSNNPFSQYNLKYNEQ